MGNNGDELVDLRREFVRKYLGIVALSAQIFSLLLMGMMIPNFSDPNNLTNILFQAVPYILMACGLALCVKAGGIDLSIGAYMVLGSIIAAPAINSGNFTLGILIALGCCAALGLLCGAAITFIPIPRIFVSAALTLALAFALRIVGNALVQGMSSELKHPGDINLIAAAVLIAGLMLSSVGFFILDSQATAKFAPFVAFPLSSALGAIAGIFILFRAGTAVPAAETGYITALLFLFGAVACTSLYARKATSMLAAIVAAFVLAALHSVMELMNNAPSAVLAMEIAFGAPLVAIAAYIIFCEYRKRGYFTGTENRAAQEQAQQMQQTGISEDFESFAEISEDSIEAKGEAPMIASEPKTESAETRVIEDEIVETEIGEKPFACGKETESGEESESADIDEIGNADEFEITDDECESLDECEGPDEFESIFEEPLSAQVGDVRSGGEKNNAGPLSAG